MGTTKFAPCSVQRGCNMFQLSTYFTCITRSDKNDEHSLKSSLDSLNAKKLTGNRLAGYIFTPHSIRLELLLRKTDQRSRFEGVLILLQPILISNDDRYKDITGLCIKQWWNVISEMHEYFGVPTWLTMAENQYKWVHRLRFECNAFCSSLQCNLIGNEVAFVVCAVARDMKWY